MSEESDTGSRIPWPSPRAQWSAFFAVVLIMLNISSIQGEAALLGRFVGFFLIFYFPVAWIYNYDFSLLGGSTSED